MTTAQSVIGADCEALAREADTASRLFDCYHLRLYRYCSTRLRDPENAEDAAQETLLRAAEELAHGARPEFESAWLFHLAEEICTSRNANGHAAICDDVTGLPATARRALEWRERDREPFGEIAARLGVPQSSAERLVFLARSAALKLRQAIDLGSLAAAAKSAFALKAATAVVAAGVVLAPASAPERQRDGGGPPAAADVSAASTPARPQMRAPRTRADAAARGVGGRARREPRTTATAPPADAGERAVQPAPATELPAARDEAASGAAPEGAKGAGQSPEAPPAVESPVSSATAPPASELPPAEAPPVQPPSVEAPPISIPPVDLPAVELPALEPPPAAVDVPALG